MIVVEPSVDIVGAIDGAEILRQIERCGRVCYKSEDKIKDGSAEDFVRMLIRRGHETPLEHGSVTLRFTVDRGVSHELVRHRIASYSQESTRYCDYTADRAGGEIQVIRPFWLDHDKDSYKTWYYSCSYAEKAYFALRCLGWSPQEARGVLPMSLKTEVVMTANLREWRHFLRLRTAPDAHPQMRQAAGMALALLKMALPVVFEDIDP